MLKPTPLLRRALLLGSALLVAAACGRTTVRAPQNGARPVDVAARVARVERGLLPPIRVQGRSYTPSTIEERMRVHGVPAVSVAVINDGRIEWARAYGLADVEGARAATTATLFQAASMSKPVASMGALRLVQEGRLGLDEDVNGRLRSWRVPAPGYRPREIVPVAITPDVLNQYVGVYAPPAAPFRLTVKVEGGQLMVTQPGAPWIEVIPTGTDVFTPTVPAPLLRFQRDASGKVVALMAGDRRLERVP